MWAQRKNLVSLTINVEDCKNPVITLEPTKLYFKGTGGPDKKTYEVTIDLFNEIDTEVRYWFWFLFAIWLVNIPLLAQESKYFVRERSIEFFLRKKEEGPYWPTIFKDKKKVHWLKIDFNRWRDEDDSEPEENGGEESQDLDEVSVRFWYMWNR